MSVLRRTAGLLALGLMAMSGWVPTALAAKTGEAVGEVKAVFRRVQVLPGGRGGDWQKLEKGDKVHKGDVVRTGPRGRTRIEMFDRIASKNAGPTVVNIGSTSEVEIEEFHARKSENKSSGVMALIKGTVRAFTKGFGGRAAFSVRVGTSLCGIRGSEVQVFAGVPRAQAQGGAPFQGGGPSTEGRPANVSCFSGDCFAFPMPQGGGGGPGFIPPGGAPGLWAIDPMQQLIMGNSNDPSTWRRVVLTPQRRGDLLNQSGVPGVSQGVLENEIFQQNFGGGGGPGSPAPNGGRAFLPPSQLGGGPILNLPPTPGGGVDFNHHPGGHGGASSNRFSNFDTHGGGTLTQGSTFHDGGALIDDDDDPSRGGGTGDGTHYFADGLVGAEQGTGWSGSLSELTQYQTALQVLRMLGQAIVDGNLKAFMDSFSPNATQDTSIFRNGFLDDLQRDQNSSVNLDFEVFEYRLAGTAWSGGTLIVRLRWLLTINGTQVQTGVCRILFDRDSGFRIIAWLGAAPFGRNDSATQSQVAAGDQNVSSGGLITGSGSLGLNFVSLPLDADDDTMFGVSEGNSTVVFQDYSTAREAAVAAGPNLMFYVDALSADFGFWTVGTREWADGAPYGSGPAEVFRCEFNPSFSDLGSVSPAGIPNAFQQFTFSAPGQDNHTFAFRLPDGRWGIGRVIIDVPAGGVPKTISFSYEFKLASEPGTTTVDPSASDVCNEP